MVLNVRTRIEIPTSSLKFQIDSEAYEETGLCCVLFVLRWTQLYLLAVCRMATENFDNTILLPMEAAAVVAATGLQN